MIPEKTWVMCLDLCPDAEPKPNFEICLTFNSIHFGIKTAYVTKQQSCGTHF